MRFRLYQASAVMVCLFFQCKQVDLNDIGDKVRWHLSEVSKSWKNIGLKWCAAAGSALSMLMF